MPEPTDQIICTFVYEIYSKNGWSAVRYRDRGTQKVFQAVGNNLPKQKNLVVCLHGKWEMNKHDGRKQFAVHYHDIPQINEKEAIIAYLQALKCNIGKAKAVQIYEKFGNNTWEIIDEHPEELTRLTGISINTVQKLKQKQKESKNLLELLNLCREAKVVLAPSQMRKIASDMKENMLPALTENPYILTERYGLPFDKSDAIAMSMEIPAKYLPRIEAGINTIFKTAYVRGNVCIPKENITEGRTVYNGLVAEAMQFLKLEEDDIKKAINQMWLKGTIKSANGFLFQANMFEEEQALADNLKRLLNADRSGIGPVDVFIEEFEKENFKLADSQQEAVRRVFKNCVNIITGGPGTGKTTVTRAILYCHQKVFGYSSEPILLAPTGKAARRMSEATGYPAQTIHSAVGYRGDDIPADADAALEGNLIIIDEASMMDMRIARILTEKIRTGARVVLVGDPDQLPSVGCGNVLADMIRSGAVPVTKLTVIFRQAGENPIITNSHRINEGRTDLLYSRTFRFIQTQSAQETFEEACKLYFRCVKAYGISSVCMLNPQRNHTDLSVAVLNKKLQEMLHKHPAMLGLEQPGEFSMYSNGNSYFVGDRVMQLKNTEKTRNGDIGVIREIGRYPNPDEPSEWLYFAMIEFNEDGYLLEYNQEDIKNIDLAYCITIHKSQGSEYKVVIEIISKEHPSMRKRQIVYTAITRAKEAVALIGELDALDIAVKTGEAERRFTLLANRLRINPEE